MKAKNNLLNRITVIRETQSIRMTQRIMSYAGKFENAGDALEN